MEDLLIREQDVDEGEGVLKVMVTRLDSQPHATPDSMCVRGGQG